LIHCVAEALLTASYVKTGPWMARSQRKAYRRCGEVASLLRWVAEDRKAGDREGASSLLIVQFQVMAYHIYSVFRGHDRVRSNRFTFG